MGDSIFTYGSLTFPAAMEAVTGRSFSAVKGRLCNYDRYILRGKRYPGLVFAPDAVTEGTLYLDVDPESLHLLDRFEDPVYERRCVEIEVDDGTRREAFVYVIPDSQRSELSDARWSAEQFRETHLDSYLEMCRRFYERETVK